MSDDQLDNEFKNRIKEVFDNYDDDTSHEGWMLLREKYPEKESTRFAPLFWRYSGVAAILLAVLSIGLWFMIQHTGTKNLVVKNNGHKGPVIIKPTVIVKNNAVQVDSGLNTTIQKAVKAGNNVQRSIAYQKPVKTVNAHGHVKPAAMLPVIVKQAYALTNPVKSNVAGKKPAVNNTTPYAVDNSAKNATAYTKPAVSISPLLITDSAKTAINSNNKTQGAVVNQVVDVAKKPSVVAAQKQPEKSVQSLFANDNKYALAHNNTDEIKLKSRRVVFGVYAATYVNYAKGSNNQFNAGGGISSDIRLTPNLSIVTGVAIAQNSFNYNSITGTSPISPGLAMASVNYGNAAVLRQLSPTSKELNANLVGLDVPVDLKYLFNPEKGNLYIAAGLSSGAFINETYNYSYSYNIDNNVQPSQDATTRKSFDNFYFAKMLNLSFGVGYPLGNGSKLFIEPFLKYPITGLGDQHILFGTGGVNLKFNFDTRGRK